MNIALIHRDDTNANYARVSDMTGMDLTSGQRLTSLCYRNIFVPQCTNNTFSTYDFILNDKNPALNFVAYFQSYDFYMQYGFIKDGVISNGDGSLFTADKTCYTKIRSDNDEFSFFLNTTTCCKSFDVAPEASANLSRCKRFRSRTIVYNSDFSINWTMAVNYTFTDNLNQLAAVANITPSLQELYIFNYIIQCDTIFTPICNITLPTEPNRIIIYMNLYDLDAYTVVIIPIIGTFITRNNQTLMQEGRAFTPQDDCLYFSDQIQSYPNTYTSEFCCKEFE
uniref:Uncharacterized protein n=1 Tax=Panagrolaimus davidi TaxID=227884 RepID=A0A914PUH0_9BILA